MFFKERKMITTKPHKILHLTGAAPAQASEERKLLLQRALCLIDVGAWSEAEYSNFQSRLLIVTADDANHCLPHHQRNAKGAYVLLRRNRYFLFAYYLTQEGQLPQYKYLILITREVISKGYVNMMLSKARSK